MKILFILPANPSSAPYFQYYINLMEKHGFRYDVCYWDRNMEDANNYNVNYKRFFSNHNKSNIIGKFVDYISFGKFVRMQFCSSQYDFIIVFTIQMSVFLSHFLRSKLNNKYIIDIRDYSSILRLPFVDRIFNLALSNSALNCISSNGFKKWLPPHISYCLSHNVSNEKLSYNKDLKGFTSDFPINILTIGALRDLESNIYLIKKLGNDNRFVMTFSGKGPASQQTHLFVRKNSVRNVILLGGYNKNDEDSIICKTDMMNVLLSDDINSRTLMANRFYLSVLFRKPMIVSANSETAFYVNKFNLGIVIAPKDDVKKRILDFWNHFDYIKYNAGCNAFIKQVKNDIILFENRIFNLLKEYVNI